MNKDQIIAALEKATPCQLKALADALEGKTPEKVVEQVEVKVFDIELAPAEVKEAVTAFQAAAAAKKQTAIKALKDSGRNKFSDEALAAKSQEELDSLVALIGEQPAQRAAVDFSGNGTAKVENKDEAPAAPDFIAAMAASRK